MKRSFQKRKTLAQLSFPLFLHSLLVFAATLFDTMIISAYSANAAAAVAMARQILVIAFEVSGMIGIGAVILISHSLGRDDEDRARHVAGVAIAANTLFGLAIGLVLAVAGPVVLWLLDPPEDVAGSARLYLFVVAGAMMFNGFAMASMASLRAFGQSTTILSIGSVLSVVYVVAEYLLILGAGPLPALGVLGAAAGAYLLRLLRAVSLGAAVLRAQKLRLTLRGLTDEWSLVRQMMTLSFPSVSDYIAHGFYQLFLLSFVTGFGVIGVLSRTYVMIAMAFLILVITAISQGNEVLLGYRRGEGRPELAYGQALRSSRIAALAASAIALVLWLLADPFIGLFTDDPQIRALSSNLLFLTIFVQPGIAFNTILFQSLRAVGDVRWPVLVSQSLTWGLGLPLAWFASMEWGFGVEGVWYALIIEETLKAIYMVHRWTTRSGLHHEAA